MYLRSDVDICRDEIFAGTIFDFNDNGSPFLTGASFNEIDGSIGGLEAEVSIQL